MATSNSKKDAANSSNIFKHIGPVLLVLVLFMGYFTSMNQQNDTPPPHSYSSSGRLFVMSPETPKYLSTSSSVGDLNHTSNPALLRSTNSTNQGSPSLSFPVSNQDINACKSPVEKLVYLKTHKTGSTTLASILERYGYVRNLTFAVGKSHVLSYVFAFNRKNVLPFPHLKPHEFDLLTNHARYNRAEMDFVVPGATYITILRNSADQLESAFGYYEMYKGMHIANTKTAFEKFMKKPKFYFDKQNYLMWRASRNGLLYDLGFDHKFDENIPKIDDHIKQLEKDFDLVLITEYFDESLVLLKRLLCWTFEDILYVAKGVRSESHHYTISKQTAEKVRKWNIGDVRLYEHFNKTLWMKINSLGSTFWDEVREFQSLKDYHFNKCVDDSKKNKSDRRVEKFVIKSKNDFCVQLMRGDIHWTPLIRKSMVKRFG